MQICREEYPRAVCVSLWFFCEISIITLDLTMVSSLTLPITERTLSFCSQIRFLSPINHLPYVSRCPVIACSEFTWMRGVNICLVRANLLVRLTFLLFNFCVPFYDQSYTYVLKPQTLGAVVGSVSCICPFYKSLPSKSILSSPPFRSKCHTFSPYIDVIYFLAEFLVHHERSFSS